jgi:hypothetical protein
LACILQNVTQHCNLISNGRHYIAWPYLVGMSICNLHCVLHLALITITQLNLTFVTFLMYYQFIYIMNNVISSLFKCYCCTYITYIMSSIWYQITGFGYTFSIFKLVICVVLDDSFFHSLFLLYHSKRTPSFFLPATLTIVWIACVGVIDRFLCNQGFLYLL